MSLKNIEHFFVLMLENRSFDHMLGFLPHVQGRKSAEGLKGTETNYINPFAPSNGTGFTVSANAGDTLEFDPGHEFDQVRTQLLGRRPGYPLGNYDTDPITMAGFVQAHEEQMRGKAELRHQAVMDGFYAGSLPVLTELATQFAVCDRWFSSMPGSTWPNRFFAHAGTSGGLFDGPSVGHMVAATVALGYKFQNGTIFDRLGSKAKIYSDDFFPQSLSLANVYRIAIGTLGSFKRDIHKRTFDKQYVFIEPNYGNVIRKDFRSGSSQHPMDSVASGEDLIKWVYDTLVDSPIWKKSALIVTYDEHGGFYDHVKPPTCEAPGDEPKYKRQNAPTAGNFDFKRLGVRVPAVIASPYTASGTVDSTIYDHSSIAATLRERFGMKGLTARDKSAEPLRDVFNLEEPRTDVPRLPEPAAVGDLPARPRTSGRVPLGPIGNAFLDVVKRAHIQLFPDEANWPDLEARWRIIRTAADAERYRNEVARLMVRDIPGLRRGRRPRRRPDRVPA